jgi:hypothetical protein
VVRLTGPLEPPVHGGSQSLEVGETARTSQWICIICSPLLIIERQFNYSLASGYPQTPATAGLRAAHLAGAGPLA